MTVVELMITLVLVGIGAAAVLTAMEASQSNLERHITRSSSSDEVRLAIQSLDREVRSGNVVYDPSLESYAPGEITAGHSVRVYTQSNGDFKCVQWRITSSTNELQRRAWATNWQSNPSTLVQPWRTVAENVHQPFGVAAFDRPQSNILNIDIWTGADPTEKKGKPVEVKASISGRNTIFYSTDASLSQLCGPPVPDPGQTGAGGSRVPPY